ncbi:MAG: hypothetical protein PV358_19190 [Acidimicrobiales bacterium]|nr:hypothetical protein [Acidimicrobiales bacterium]
MAEHRFDPVAFVFGGLALAAGTIVLTGGELTDEGRVLLPGGLIALGVAVLASVARREVRDAPAIEPSAAAGGENGGDHSDLDDLFAPVDDVLTSWPTDPDADDGTRQDPAAGDVDTDPTPHPSTTDGER